MITAERKEQMLNALDDMNDQRAAGNLLQDAHDFGAGAADANCHGETFGFGFDNSERYMEIYFPAFWGRLQACMIRRNLLAKNIGVC